VDSHRRALHKIQVERFPDATNWSTFERLVAGLHRRSSEELDRQQDFHQSNLVRLGYFEMIDLQVSTNVYRDFAAAAVANQWSCNLWNLSYGTSGVVHLVAFSGDIARWKRLAESYRGPSNR